MTNLNLIPVHVYGLTETYGPITKGYHMPVWETLPIKEKYARMARQGHGFITSLPVRVIKVDGVKEGELVDVKRDGKEVGEIVFFGNICAKEYYKDPEATRKLFLGGCLHSGDLAVWHEDRSVHILDRQKDIIISGSYPPLFLNTTLHYLSGCKVILLTITQAVRTYPQSLSKRC
jgi:acyl-CoA synthetase (AMP-forming)/AMP-acid ligase II